MANMSGQAYNYLDAESAMRGADRRRRLRVATLVPVVAVIVGVASIAYAGFDAKPGQDNAGGSADPSASADPTGTTPTVTPTGAPGTFASLGADVLDVDTKTIHTAAGEQIPLPDNGTRWTTGAKLPGGWIIRGDQEMSLLRPNGQSEQIAEGLIEDLVISRDGTRIAWSAADRESIQVATITDAGVTPGALSRQLDKDEAYPVAWVGDNQLIINGVSNGRKIWTNWDTAVDAEKHPSSWIGGDDSVVLGVNVNNHVLDTGDANPDFKGDHCQMLRLPDVWNSEQVSYTCWNESRNFGAISPDGRWLLLGGSGYLDLVNTPNHGTWPIRANCGGDADRAVWVAANATVVVKANDWYKCTVDGEVSAPVKSGDRPAGVVMPAFGV